MPPLEGPSAALFRHRARGARSRSAVERGRRVQADVLYPRCGAGHAGRFRTSLLGGPRREPGVGVLGDPADPLELPSGV